MQGNDGSGNGTAVAIKASFPKNGPGIAEEVGWGDGFTRTIIQLMKDLGPPCGVDELCYGEGDVDGLVEGTTKQRRLLAGAPQVVLRRTWRTPFLIHR